MARFAALDDLGLLTINDRAKRGKFDSARDGLPESSWNRVGQIPSVQREISLAEPHWISPTSMTSTKPDAGWRLHTPDKVHGDRSSKRSNSVRLRPSLARERSPSATSTETSTIAKRIVEKLGFQKLRVAPDAATRCLDTWRETRSSANTSWLEPRCTSPT